MNVPSFQFLLLALAGLVLFRISANQAWRQAVLLAINLVFFQTFFSGPVQCLPFVGFLLLGYGSLFRLPGRMFGWVTVAAIAAAFFWLKKYSFVPSSLVLGFPYVTVGLSYVFFRVMQLAIDTQQQAMEARPSLISYLNYTLNFTCLVSGPIQRYEDYAAMERAPAPIGPVSAGIALERIIIGLFKVFVLSAALLSVQHGLIDGLGADPVFARRLAAGVAIVAIYPVYLYFNFSGYTDFVIGVARWFGIVLPENFNRAFQAENFITFWTRWHITLSTWLKTYVYQPLLMSLMTRFPSRRAESTLVVFSLFVTFFLVGAWHGQTRAFLFYGVLQGFGISANKLYQMTMTARLGKKPYRELCAHYIYRSCCRGLTFTWFSFTLLWFWCDWRQLDALYHAFGNIAALLAWPLLFAVSTVVLAIWVAAFELALSVRWPSRPLVTSRYVRTMWGTALIAIVLGLNFLLNSPAPPIVYKNF